METVFKITITAVVLCAIYYQLVLVRTVWRSQIDPRATISRLLKKLEPENTLIATRDPKKIYQSGEAVGEVVGEVSTSGSRVTFKHLANTTNLQMGPTICVSAVHIQDRQYCFSDRYVGEHDR